MFAFQDFIPQVQRQRLIPAMSEYESLQEVVTRANRWIEQRGVRVINVETLIVPALPRADAEITAVRLESPNNTLASYQMIRVWYADERTPTQPYTGATTRLAPHGAENTDM